MVVISLAGEVGSEVSAHLDKKEGVLTASILTSTEHYFVEPSNRHFSQSHDFHMISYRASDLKLNITGSVTMCISQEVKVHILLWFFRMPSQSYCGTDSATPTFHAPSELPFPLPQLPPQSSPISAESARLSRKRQATPTLTLDSCPMFLVATTDFHQAYSRELGLSLNVENTILFMVSVFHL